MSKLTVVLGFLIALAFAFPTFGGSLLLFFICKYFIDKSKSGEIAYAALRTKDNDHGGITLSYATLAAIKMFFKKYGTSVHTFKMHTDPFLFYTGYVSIDGSDEFVCVILRSGNEIVVTSFWPEMHFGNDLASLMLKKQFMDDIVNSIQKQVK